MPLSEQQIDEVFDLFERANSAAGEPLFPSGEDARRNPLIRGVIENGGVSAFFDAVSLAAMQRIMTQRGNFDSTESFLAFRESLDRAANQDFILSDEIVEGSELFCTLYIGQAAQWGT